MPIFIIPSLGMINREKMRCQIELKRKAEGMIVVPRDLVWVWHSNVTGGTMNGSGSEDSEAKKMGHPQTGKERAENLKRKTRMERSEEKKRPPKERGKNRISLQLTIPSRRGRRKR